MPTSMTIGAPRWKRVSSKSIGDAHNKRNARDRAYRYVLLEGSRPAYQFTAYCINCAEVRNDSFRLMRWRCDSTVLTLKLSASAVCRVDRPLPIMCRTCSSRLVRLSIGFAEI